MAKQKTVFYCTECGNETLKWQGQCPACGSWNTIVEEPAAPKKKSAAASGTGRSFSSGGAVPINAVDTSEENRFHTGMGELDRVLGGGAVEGSLVLVGGAPGIGKSTLLLQLSGNISTSHKVLYVSGEESGRQIKMRAERLGVSSGELFILIETCLSDILREVDTLKPDVLIIDSIQMCIRDRGSAGQAGRCALRSKSGCG